MPVDEGPNMELRALVAVALSLLVLIFSQWWFGSPTPASPPAAVEGEEAGRGDAGRGGAGVAEEPPGETRPGRGSTSSSPGEPAAPEPRPAAGSVAVGADVEQHLVVETARFRATLTNRGARMASWVLTDYRSDRGGPLDLVVGAFARLDELPLGLVSPDAPGDAEAANQALYEVTIESGRSTAEAPAGERIVRPAGPDKPVRVRFRWSDGAGWEVEKALTFPADGYMVDLEVAARHPRSVPLYVGLGPGLVEGIDTSTSSFYLTQGAVYLRGGGVEHWSGPDLLEEPQALEGAVTWGGVESNYFLTLFVTDGVGRARLAGEPWPGPGAGVAPSGATTARGATTQRDDDIQTDGGAEDDRGPVARFQLAVPVEGLAVPIYAGPKHYELLSAHGHQLERAVDFGIFGILAYPLLVGLEWIYGFVRNWGLAIILLTVIIRVLFLPLTHKSMKSMRKMQTLQPEMQAIRARYKGVKDLEKRQQMNTEVMELYKKHGVSPLGGCLPMLLQMPVLFAFYALLSVSIQLRQAPFALWIQDLSKYDPYLVLPILMGVSMYAQQRMSPTTADPMQARIFRLMPVMFTVFFLWLPSGLVLYWFTNNLLGIGQQALVNRQLEAPEPRAADTRKAGKKRKSGRGKRKKGR